MWEEVWFFPRILPIRLEAANRNVGCRRAIASETMEHKLTQADWDDLSAYFDGELADDQARRVESMLASDEQWRAALRHLKALDAALDTQNVPEAPSDLSRRIIANNNRIEQRRTIRVIRWAVPLAAAAVIVLAVGLLHKFVSQDTNVNKDLVVNRFPAPRPTQPPDTLAQKANDEFVVQNLGFFRDYDVVNNLETIEAIDLAEKQATGT